MTFSTLAADAEGVVPYNLDITPGLAGSKTAAAASATNCFAAVSADPGVASRASVSNDAIAAIAALGGTVVSKNFGAATRTAFSSLRCIHVGLL